MPNLKCMSGFGQGSSRENVITFGSEEGDRNIRCDGSGAREIPETEADLIKSQLTII